MYFPVKAKDLSNAVNKFKWARQLNEQLDDPKVRFQDCHANIDAIIMDGESFDPNKWFDAEDKRRLLGKHLQSLLKIVMDVENADNENLEAFAKCLDSFGKGDLEADSDEERSAEAEAGSGPASYHPTVEPPQGSQHPPQGPAPPSKDPELRLPPPRAQPRRPSGGVEQVRF